MTFLSTSNASFHPLADKGLSQVPHLGTEKLYLCTLIHYLNQIWHLQPQTKSEGSGVSGKTKLVPSCPEP